jgi:hypothetical protein
MTSEIYSAYARIPCRDNIFSHSLTNIISVPQIQIDEARKCEEWVEFTFSEI